MKIQYVHNDNAVKWHNMNLPIFLSGLLTSFNPLLFSNVLKSLQIYKDSTNTHQLSNPLLSLVGNYKGGPKVFSLLMSIKDC